MMVVILASGAARAATVYPATTNKANVFYAIQTFQTNVIFLGSNYFSGPVVIGGTEATTRMDSLIVTNTLTLGGLELNTTNGSWNFNDDAGEPPDIIAGRYYGSGAAGGDFLGDGSGATNMTSASFRFGTSLLVSGSTTNMAVNPSLGIYQRVSATDNINFIYFTNAPGAVSIKIRPNGADRLLSFPTNWVPLYTNGLTLSGATWILTLTNAVGTTGPRAALFSAVADGTDPTNVIWGVQISP